MVLNADFINQLSGRFLAHFVQSYVTFRRRQHEISKVDRTVFSDVGVASENGK